MNAPNCKPLNSVYCNLKVKLAGSLSEHDLDGLYSCTLCNDCGLAGFNRGAREMAVGRGRIVPHVGSVRENISQSGNPYGAAGSRSGKGPGRDGTILFRGCTPAYKTPEILAAVEGLLERKGIEYGLMDDEPCCGNILFNLGDRVMGSGIVDSNIARFKEAGVKRIITVCPGCYAAFNKYYKGRNGFDPEVILAVDLLDGMVARGDGFVVQDPCHAKEKSGIVRGLLPGAGSKSASPCCGAGSGLIAHDRLLADAKAEKVFGGGPTKIVTYCPFCYLHLSSVKPGEVEDIYVLLDRESAGNGVSYAMTEAPAVKAPGAE